MLLLMVQHRRSINTEGKAKVVVVFWGTEFIEFLAALAIVTRTIYSSIRPGAQ